MSSRIVNDVYLRKGPAFSGFVPIDRSAGTFVLIGSVRKTTTASLTEKF